MKATVIASIVLFAMAIALGIAGIPLTAVGGIRMVRYKIADPALSYRYRGMMITGAMLNSAAVISLAIAIGLLPWTTIIGTAKTTHQAILRSVM